MIKVVALVVCVALDAAFAANAVGQACPGAAATVVSVQGTVEVKRGGDADWRPAQLDDVYCPGDTIRVQARSRADVALADQSVLRLGENATLVIEGVQPEGSYVLGLLQGAAHFFSRQGARNLEVNTPFTVAGVRGTEFALDVGADQTVVRVLEGRVLARNAGGSVALADGETAVAERGRAPVVRLEAHPRDAVRWALYYQPVLYVGPDAARDQAPWRRPMRESAAAARRGDLAGAFALVDGVPDAKITDPAFFTQRASLLLAVGKVEAAEADLARARALAPSDADALALQTVIALAQNRTAEAAQAAEQAVAAAPESATARIALSYAQQARFDLEGARATLAEAVRRDPENALAWARLAELEASFGDLRAAQAAAERAASLEPNLARTQTVLGFAQLTQVKTAEARATFEKAIALDSADPLPRLGIGLARIRDGDLAGGGRDVEAAASLDPGNALIRSYLGKVYFEEKRTGLDEREYAAAKQLDPNDPTPWFYDAIAKQTTNRPVEALRDFQKAIDLNDNRAVYRSRLLLDSDLAARSASLGRIYSDLGFQSLALVEGWKSVNVDPGNYSAHRLLADSYAALPRHEIARVSELLQSQLLQPANMTPIQPRLAESNLFLLSSQGPATLSFQEFNPLFNRNRVGLQATGLGGSDDTWVGEGIVSGIWNRASFSAGYSGFGTDGFRDNNDQDDDIVDALAQVELTAQTSLQGEFRYRDLENGDLELRFLNDDFSPFSNERTRTYTGRLGLRHAFSPSSTVLLSYIHQDLHTDFDDFVPDPLFGDFAIGLDVDEVGDTGEAQYLYRSRPLGWLGGVLDRVDVTSGFGYASVGSDETSTTTIALPPPDEPITDVVERDPDVRHGNVYAYAQVGLARDVTLTLGASGDFFDEDDGVGSENQGNPKVGVTWNPSFSRGTTVRAAGFRVLTRTLVTQQTLEPTQVAGFNQFFDDPPGTDAWRYGAAVDQKFGDSVFAGVELSGRDLDVPQSIFGGEDFVVQKTDWQEWLARTYAFWTPHPWVSTRVEYQYESFDREREAQFAFKDVETHRVPFGVQFFHPTGIGASFGATYLHQNGTFLRNADLTFDAGSRDFWVLDTAIRYRLPQRYGVAAIGVNNLLDEDASYQATDVRNPSPRPGRFVFCSLTLAIP
jgi:tetratricopeptide (TPR) repeat protein